ncbi:hypothetical protein ACET3Z_027217 [Daucus carota]
MEESSESSGSSALPMLKTGRILRRSIYSFLSNYQYFTSTALVLIPFSAAVLLAQPLVPYASILPLIHNRLQALFYAAGFPPSAELFKILSLKLSQTITSSILVLPFTLSFLLIAKASIIQAFHHYHKQSPRLKFSSFLSLYTSLLSTQICNSIVILSANATCFSILFIAFNILEAFDLLSSPTSTLFLSATAAVFYSIILANAIIISNLALVLSGMEKSGGYMSIIKACVLIRGRNSTALSLALPLNLILAAIEALFQYRVVGAYYNIGSPTPPMALEWMFIAYLYSIFVVLDTIVSCLFYKSCTASSAIKDQTGRYSYRIDIAELEEQCNSLAIVKTCE